MDSTRPTNLEEAIRQSGEGWLIDMFSPPSEALNHLKVTLAAVQKEASARLRGNAPNFSEEAIVATFARNPTQVRAFFQALGGTRTPQMLLMVWRIIQGMDIKTVELLYARQDSFRLAVTLESPYGEEDQPYISSSIQDFTLFRHIGTMEISGGPVFDGFYPLKLK